jgi:hypothetical protein
MGWMNDTLRYAKEDPIYRKHMHAHLAHTANYCLDERYILPISHDEVVHLKKSFLDKMPGDYWQKFAGARAFAAFMTTHPGAKLWFMGCEFGQFAEWNECRQLDWFLLDYDAHARLQHYYAALNTEYKFSTLQSFFSDFNAALHMDIGKDALVTEYPRFNSKKIDKYRVIEGGSDIVKFLFTLDGVAEVVHPYDAVDGRMNNCGEIRRVTFSMASAGKMMNSLYIFDNGYIAIGGPICDGIIFFNVGGEATSELYEIFKANTELVTVINPDSTLTDGLVEATTSAPANEVAPE